MAAAPPSPNQVWNTWAASVLSKVGAPLSQTNYDTLWNWSHAESGSNVMRWNNPLNTTQPYPGATNANSVGVKIYPNASAGAQATANTLLNGYYPDIVQNLRSGLPTSQWSTKAQAQVSKWGTGLSFLHATAAAPTAAGRLPNQGGSTLADGGSDPFGIGAAFSSFGSNLNRQLLGGTEVVLGVLLMLAGLAILVLMAVRPAGVAAARVAEFASPAGRAVGALRAARAPSTPPAAARPAAPSAPTAPAARPAPAEPEYRAGGRVIELSPKARAALRARQRGKVA